jgi:hypothetical protein
MMQAGGWFEHNFYSPLIIVKIILQPKVLQDFLSRYYWFRQMRIIRYIFGYRSVPTFHSGFCLRSIILSFCPSVRTVQYVRTYSIVITCCGLRVRTVSFLGRQN